MDLYSSYQLGIRIVSNSWGSKEIYSYNERCYDVDRFIWENSDMLVLFAAGNDGEKG